jgi:hypothetical protein
MLNTADRCFVRATIGSYMRSTISAAVFAAMAVSGSGEALAQYPASATRAAYAVEPFTPPGQITIQGAGVRLRAEPYTNPPAQVLSSGSTGLPLTVIGIARLPDWNWYQVILKSGQKAFIRSDYTSAPSRGAGVATSVAAAAPVGAAPVAVAPVGAASVGVAPAPLPTATRVDNLPVSSPFASTPAYSGSTPSTAQTPIVAAPTVSTPPVSSPSVSTSPAPYTPAPYASATVPVAPAAPSTSGDAPISLTPRSTAPPIPVQPPTEPSYPSGLQSKPPG